MNSHQRRKERMAFRKDSQRVVEQVHNKLVHGFDYTLEDEVQTPEGIGRVTAIHWTQEGEPCDIFVKFDKSNTRVCFSNPSSLRLMPCPSPRKTN